LERGAPREDGFAEFAVDEIMHVDQPGEHVVSRAQVVLDRVIFHPQSVGLPAELAWEDETERAEERAVVFFFRLGRRDGKRHGYTMQEQPRRLPPDARIFKYSHFFLFIIIEYGQINKNSKSSSSTKIFCS
jgi:hypothetical protein